MNVQKAMARALITPLAVLGVAAIAPTSASAATTDSLQGEILSSLAPAQTTSGSCNSDGSGSITFTASGVAAGPYPGTFTESGSVTFGSTVVGADGVPRGQILSFSADFTITSVVGEVTGHKGLQPGPPPAGPGDAGGCFTSFDGVYSQIIASYLTYTANTPFGEDSGTSAVNMNTAPNPTANSSSAQFREFFYSPNPSAVPPQCSDGIDNDGDGLIDYPADPGCTSPADDSESPNPPPPGPATVTVNPPDAVNPVGTDHTITATVDNINGDPVSGVVVLVSVTGSSSTSGSCTTDSTGGCSFTYTGPGLPGADLITACADSNGNGAVDLGEPCATATKAWVLPTTTAGHVTGGGQIYNATHTDKIAFGFNAKSDSNGVKGECNVVDPSTNTKITCLDVTSVVETGTHATLFGDATVNGVATTYRIDVVDNGEPGRTDTFAIQTGTGYTAGGVLAGGNIQVH